jgi:hypothetical protein
MFVRATTIHADQTRIDEGIAFVRDRVVPVVDSLPGSLGLSMFVDRETGVVTVTSAWDSSQARRASEDALAELRTAAAQALGGGTPAVELLELAVLDRRRPAEPGFWSRTTRVSIDPHRIDSAIDAYSASTMHDVQLLDGYCSAVLLVDRASGLGAVSVIFDSLRALEASRDRAQSLRDAGSAKSGAEVTEVRESEIVLAGIRMPQSG